MTKSDKVLKVLIKITIFCLFIFVGTLPAFAQGDYYFVENKKQWDKQILYKVDLQNGALFLESNCLTYNFVDPRDVQHGHDHNPFTDSINQINAGNNKSNLTHFHAYKVSFQNAKSLPTVVPSNSVTDYVNYFKGNNSNNWIKKVKRFKDIEYQNVYDNINLKLSTRNNALVYDFIVNPGGDPSKIEMKYDGVDQINIVDNNLVIKTSVNEVTEIQPYAYQSTAKGYKQVKCSFNLEGNTLKFTLPEGFDNTQQLIIDPTLIFSTYSGSKADNWGFTATYDAAGNVYSGGIVSDIGYPVSTGAFQTNYGGGSWDIGIIKYNTTGTQRLWATYLGGSSAELPHSIVVNEKGELLIFGVTGSSDFPITKNAYCSTFKGGSAITYDFGSIIFNNGTDLYVSKLSSDGATLLASTFIGGTANDGFNFRAEYDVAATIMTGNDSLYHNYGDGARGEIIADSKNYVYVGTCTFSSDFPMSSQSIQRSNHGREEGVVFKLTPDLSQLVWSTYLGGSADDAIYSIDLDSNDDLYVAGGTNSTDLPVTNGAYNTKFNGGSADAFLTHITQDGRTLVGCTYFGSNKYDQAYFVRTDSKDSVFIYGQTNAPDSTLIYKSKYNIPNSGQFIAKFNNQLTQLSWSGVFGSGNGKPNISPTAFSVDVCDRIYVSGSGREWPNAIGWVYNSTLGYYVYDFGWAAIQGTKNMQVTTNAYMKTTDGMDFYLGVFDNKMSQLVYGTFFGEPHTGGASIINGKVVIDGCYNSGKDHVDGGTSRFDKRGNVYQSVCASCGACEGFPTTQGVWSTTNNSDNCNNAVFVFSLASDFTHAGFTQPSYGCAPLSVTFNNTSNGSIYLWDFGDGQTSTAFNPTHTFQKSGNYTVKLKSFIPEGCNLVDSATHQILVLSNKSSTNPSVSICKGDNIFIGVDATNDTTVHYQWYPSTGLMSPTSATTLASPQTTTTYLLIVSNGTCRDSVYQTVNVKTSIHPKGSINFTYNATCWKHNTLFTLNDSTGLSAIKWNFGNPSTGVNNTSSLFNPVHYFDSIGSYKVTMIPFDQCPIDTITATIKILPSVNISLPNVSDCSGNAHTLDAGVHYKYLWNTGQTTRTISVSLTGNYWITVTDTGICSGQSTDTVKVYIAANLLSKKWNNWYFGKNAAVTFNSKPPKASGVNITQVSKGSASISDDNGRLLFYTNGTTVYDSLNKVLTNGTGLLGNYYATQMSLIVPFTNNTNKYYLFNLDSIAGPKGLTYSIVDMSTKTVLSPKNILLYTPVTEKLTAIKHSNLHDYWVVAHQCNSNAFLVYLVTDSGIHLQKVINVGTPHGTGTDNVGYMQFSLDGYKIALANFASNFAEIFDFDRTTGNISNPIKLSNIDQSYVFGLEFSPDRSKLYVSGSKLYQFDLLAGSAAQISASKTIIYAGAIQSLQLATDGKIYTTQSGSTYLGCIASPNLLGNNCQFSVNSVSLNGGTCQYGLNNIIKDKSFYHDFTYKIAWAVNHTRFTLTNTSDIDSVHWYFGDGQTSTLLTPFHIYSKAGTYQVNTKIYGYCLNDSISKLITIQNILKSGNGNVGANDTTVCLGNSVTYNTNNSLTNILWSTGSSEQSITVNIAGKYWVHGTDVDGFVVSDTMTLRNYALPSIYLGKDTTICTGDSIIYDAGAGRASYFWQNGSTSQKFTNKNAGKVFVKITDQNGCTNSDTVNVSQYALPAVSLGADISICEGQSLLVDAGGNFKTYLWQDGTTSHLLQITTAGKYWVTVSDSHNCRNSDTVLVTVIPRPAAPLTKDTTVWQGTQLNYNFSTTGTIAWYNSNFQITPFFTGNPYTTPALYNTTVYDVENIVNGCPSIRKEFTVFVKTPLTTTMSSLPNTVCYSNDCSCQYATIKINEVMAMPSPWPLPLDSIDGSIYDTLNWRQGEWIELFNPNPCKTVDISGYMLGNTAKSDGIKSTSQVFRIPNNTVLAPYGFAIIRGKNAQPVNPSLLVSNGGKTIEIIVKDSLSLCLNGSWRFWLPDAGGWLGLYDNFGTPLDAISWVDTTRVNFNQKLCAPPGASVSQLVSYSEIPSYLKNYVGVVINWNRSFQRSIDGLGWVVNNPGLPTYGTCNGVCLQPPNPVPCSGSASVVTNGGNTPYTYKWDDANHQTTATATGLCAGTYHVLITDKSNNFKTDSVVVKSTVPHIKIGNDTTYCNNFTRILDAGVSGMSYQWNTFPVQTTQKITVTQPGFYWVKVTTPIGCVVCSGINIYQDFTPTVHLNTNAAVCKGSALSAGIGAYNYIWSTGQTTSSIIINKDGKYVVQVSNHCGVAKDSVNLKIYNLPVIPLGKDTAICYGKTITFNAGANMQYYLWNNNNTSQYLTTGIAGKYYVNVIDKNNCQNSDTVNLKIYAPLQKISIIKSDALCFGSASGMIAVSAIGTGKKYVYQLNNSTQTDSIFTKLSKGIYSLSFTDTLGCKSSPQSVTIAEPAKLILGTGFYSTQVSCYNYSDGTIYMKATGGVRPYLFSLNTNPLQVDSVYTNLPVGKYAMMVQDANGCNLTSDALNIINPPQLKIDSVSVVEKDCFHLGSIDVKAKGGTGSYSYSLNNNPLQASPHLIAYKGGNYLINLYDIKNCRDTLHKSVPEKPDLNFRITKNDETCPNRCDGSISLDIFSGTPPYTINWYNGSNDNTLQNICSGDHKFTVHDGMLCVVDSAIQINFKNPAPLVHAAADKNVITVGYSAQLISTQSTNFTYLWTPSTGLNFDNIYNPVASPIKTTQYKVTVTDQATCTASDSLLIDVMPGDCGEPFIFVPNAFTPDNSEGGNNILYVRSSIVTEMTFTVYNRWGKVVFETSDMAKGWDGSYNGERMPAGVYVYYLQATCKDKQVFTKKGNVTILR